MKLKEMGEFFDGLADIYDEHQLHNIESAEIFYPYTAKLLPMQAGCKVLDLGCGTGLELETYFRLNPNANITGVDIAGGMLRALAEKFPDKELTLIHASYFDTALGDAAFDAAVSVESLHHYTMEQKIPLYRKLHASLKDGGYFVLTDYMAKNDAEEAANFRIYAEIKSEMQAFDDAYYHYDTPLTCAHEMEALRLAGFHRVELLNRWQNTHTLIAYKQAPHDTEQTQNDRPVILYLCDYQAPYGGNFIASLTRLDEALRARGVRTLYAFPAGAASRGWYGRMEARGMRLVPLVDGGTNARVRQLLRLIDEQHVTILHVHFGLFPLAELIALRRPGLRLILHFHSDFSAGRAPTLKSRLRDAVKRIPERLIGKRLTKITVSERSARTTDDCVRLHNALVTERFTDELWTREEGRNALGIAEDATLVLVFGWSPYIKGVDVAANALRRLMADGHTRFVLGVVCGREYTAARMRAFIRENTSCTGEEPWLRLLPPREDVFGYHKAADIMLSASRSETFSYALLEAIATGRPCAASDIPGVRWAETFDTVTFFVSGDDAALAETLVALDEMRRDPAYETRLQRASERALCEFGIAEWIEGMLAVYGID